MATVQLQREGHSGDCATATRGTQWRLCNCNGRATVATVCNSPTSRPMCTGVRAPGSSGTHVPLYVTCVCLYRHIINMTTRTQHRRRERSLVIPGRHLDLLRPLVRLLDVPPQLLVLLIGHGSDTLYCFRPTKVHKRHFRVCWLDCH